jgi:hypothetical protein
MTQKLTYEKEVCHHFFYMRTQAEQMSSGPKQLDEQVMLQAAPLGNNAQQESSLRFRRKS